MTPERCYSTRYVEVKQRAVPIDLEKFDRGEDRNDEEPAEQSPEEPLAPRFLSCTDLQRHISLVGRPTDQLEKPKMRAYRQDDVAWASVPQ
jgi:hypothetical protein